MSSATAAPGSGLLPRPGGATALLPVRLRPVVRGDEPLLEAFFDGLSPAARRLRFHGAVRSVSPAVLRRMTHWDAQQEFALMALAEAADGPRCIGEARYAVGDGAAGEREFAVVVDDAWQRLGLGSLLLQRLIDHAAAGGVQRLVGEVMVENAAMIGLARRHGFALRAHPGDARLRMLARDIGDRPIDVTMWRDLAEMRARLGNAANP